MGAAMGLRIHSSRSYWGDFGDMKRMAKHPSDEASSSNPFLMFSWPESLGAFHSFELCAVRYVLRAVCCVLRATCGAEDSFRPPQHGEGSALAKRLLKFCS